MGKKYTASPIVKSVWQGGNRSVPMPRPLKTQEESSDWTTLDKDMVISEHEDGDHSSRYYQVLVCMLVITFLYLLGLSSSETLTVSLLSCLVVSLMSTLSSMAR